MRLFPLLPLLVAFLASAASARAAAPSIVRIWPEYRTTESFARIREYFSGREAAGGETLVRTRAGERAGYYFLVRLEHRDAPIPDARFELSLILPGQSEPRVVTFRASVPEGEHVFHLGVTGPDWPGAGVRPVAWHLAVRTAAGGELAQAQSFLWSFPAAVTDPKNAP